jgi:serine/threonine-protein kinase BUR1
MVYYS